MQRYFLSNDKNYYTKELNDMKEIDNIEDLWINSERGMKIGTYLETNLSFFTSLEFFCATRL